MMRKNVKLSAALLLALSSAFVSAPAFAHSALISSNPEQGSVIEVIPTDFALTFNEELISIEGQSVNKLSLSDASGVNYSLSETNIAGQVLSASVTAGQYPAGEYLLTYRAVSADGHPITGEIAFTVQSSTTIDSQLEEPVTTSITTEPESAGALTYLLIGLILLLGIASRVWSNRKTRRGQGN
jgi:methionine-rich copper-binding protein CopC